MNRTVMITCALTGAGDTVDRSEHVPVTPEQIAESGIAAARAGATIIHIHVRDPETGKGSRDVALYREVVERVRASDVDVIINTTAGMGGDLVLDPHDPTTFVDGTDLVSGIDRLPHVEALLPDICTLDCGSLNFGEGNLVYVSTPDMLREGAKRIQELGVRVEMEIFDTGHLWFANTLVEEGLIDAPAMYQLCMGIPYGAPADAADAGGDGGADPGGRRVGVVRPGSRCRCPGWRSRSCSAVTSASAWRTTSTWPRASRRPTRSSSSAPGRSSRAWAPRWPPPTRAARSSR